mmetsp:Transcript_94178/g.177156  ORF Transcript_94178/g.177156 Transcript_94178/m.177156 type:complete len:92 (+) Transcript_94178:1131-1406(+)
MGTLLAGAPPAAATAAAARSIQLSTGGCKAPVNTLTTDAVGDTDKSEATIVMHSSRGNKGAAATALRGSEEAAPGSGLALCAAKFVGLASP